MVAHHKVAVERATGIRPDYVIDILPEREFPRKLWHCKRSPDNPLYDEAVDGPDAPDLNEK